MYSGVEATPHSCGIMLLAKQYDTIQGHYQYGVIAVLSMRRHCRHYCGIIADLIIMIVLIIEQLQLPCRLNYTACY